MSSIRKWRKQVEAVAGEFGGEVFDGTGRNVHLRIHLPNGRKYSTSHTPSDHRSIKNLRSSLRRLAREEAR